MTLRLPLNLQQLLFVTICTLLAWGTAAKAQDLVVQVDGKQQAGKVVGASAAGVQLETGPGSVITYPLKSIKEVRMTQIPAEFAAAQKSMEARNLDAAQAQLKALEKFKGLPMDWAQQATAMMGDVYLDKGDVPKAEATFAEFQKLYPGSAQAELGLAKLAVAKKDFATAKGKLEKIVDEANKDKSVTRGKGYGYSQAFYLMGQVLESEGKANEALEDYLKTVTLFYYDRAAAAGAQQKADALRKAHPDIFVP